MRTNLLAMFSLTVKRKGVRIGAGPLSREVGQPGGNASKFGLPLSKLVVFLD